MSVHYPPMLGDSHDNEANEYNANAKADAATREYLADQVASGKVSPQVLKDWDREALSISKQMRTEKVFGDFEHAFQDTPCQGMPVSGKSRYWEILFPGSGTADICAALGQILPDAQSRTIFNLYANCGKRVHQIAEMLGVHRNTVLRRLREIRMVALMQAKEISESLTDVSKTGADDVSIEELMRSALPSKGWSQLAGSGHSAHANGNLSYFKQSRAKVYTCDCGHRLMSRDKTHVKDSTQFRCSNCQRRWDKKDWHKICS